MLARVGTPYSLARERDKERERKRRREKERETEKEGENEERSECWRALYLQGCAHPLHWPEREIGRERERERERESVCV